MKKSRDERQRLGICEGKRKVTKTAMNPRVSRESSLIRSILSKDVFFVFFLTLVFTAVLCATMPGQAHALEPLVDITERAFVTNASQGQTVNGTVNIQNHAVNGDLLDMLVEMGSDKIWLPRIRSGNTTNYNFTFTNVSLPFHFSETYEALNNSGLVNTLITMTNNFSTGITVNFTHVFPELCEYYTVAPPLIGGAFPEINGNNFTWTFLMLSNQARNITLSCYVNETINQSNVNLTNYSQMPFLGTNITIQPPFISRPVKVSAQSQIEVMATKRESPSVVDLWELSVSVKNADATPIYLQQLWIRIHNATSAPLINDTPIEVINVGPGVTLNQDEVWGAPFNRTLTDPPVIYVDVNHSIIFNTTQLAEYNYSVPNTILNMSDAIDDRLPPYLSSPTFNFSNSSTMLAMTDLCFSVIAQDDGTGVGIAFAELAVPGGAFVNITLNDNGTGCDVFQGDNNWSGIYNNPYTGNYSWVRAIAIDKRHEFSSIVIAGNEGWINTDHTFSTLPFFDIEIGNDTTVGSGNNFTGNTTIGENSSVGNDNSFGNNVTTGEDSTIGNDNNFSTNTSFGNSTVVGNNNTFGGNNDFGSGFSSGDNNQIGGGTSGGDNVDLGNDVILGVNTTLGNSTIVGDDTTIGDNVTSGDDTFFGKNTTIGDSVLIGNDVVIGDNVIIEDGAIIGDGVIIGDGAIIRAGEVVAPGITVPEGTVVDRGNITLTPDTAVKRLEIEVDPEFFFYDEILGQNQTISITLTNIGNFTLTNLSFRTNVPFIEFTTVDLGSLAIGTSIDTEAILTVGTRGEYPLLTEDLVGTIFALAEGFVASRNVFILGNYVGAEVQNSTRFSNGSFDSTPEVQAPTQLTPKMKITKKIRPIEDGQFNITLIITSLSNETLNSISVTEDLEKMELIDFDASLFLYDEDQKTLTLLIANLQPSESREFRYIAKASSSSAIVRPKVLAEIPVLIIKEIVVSPIFSIYSDFATIPPTEWVLFIIGVVVVIGLGFLIEKYPDLVRKYAGKVEDTVLKFIKDMKATVKDLRRNAFNRK